MSQPAQQLTMSQAQQPEASYRYHKNSTATHTAKKVFYEDSISQGEDSDGGEDEGGDTDGGSETMQQESDGGNEYAAYVEDAYDTENELAAEGASTMSPSGSANIDGDDDDQIHDNLSRPPVFDHGTFVSMSQESNTASRQHRHQEQRQAHQHVPTITPCPTGVSKKYRESRYAGGNVRRRECDINNAPIMVPTSTVSSAVLAKRGITHGVNKMICKRGYGANDPENIRIVNMREQLGLDFSEIRLRLNKERIAKGKDPTLSNSGVANRYNRTAPVLFSASGMTYVPLTERGNMKKRQKVAWSDENDNILVACVKEFEAKKWGEVAAMFNERTGQNADDECVSSRYTML